MEFMPNRMNQMLNRFPNFHSVLSKYPQQQSPCESLGNVCHSGANPVRESGAAALRGNYNISDIPPDREAESGPGCYCYSND